MPSFEAGGSSGSRSGRGGKGDYEKINRRRKWLGDRGEQIVLALEKSDLKMRGILVLQKT